MHVKRKKAEEKRALRFICIVRFAAPAYYNDVPTAHRVNPRHATEWAVLLTSKGHVNVTCFPSSGSSPLRRIGIIMKAVPGRYHGFLLSSFVPDPAALGLARADL